MTHLAYVSADRGVPVFGRKGCSIHTQEVLRALIRKSVRVDLFATNVEGDRPPGLEPVRLHPLPRPPKGEPAARERASLASNPNLRAALEQAGPYDFVYERYSLWSFAAMEYAQEKGIPGLLEVNAPLIEEHAQYRVLVDRAATERVAERVFAAASALLAVSDEVAEYLEKFPATRGKIHVVPNGVDPDRFPSGLQARMPKQEGHFTVGFVGTLKAWHGLQILLDAFAQLYARKPAARLLIVGNGPEYEKLTAEAAARGLADAIHFTGAVDAAEVPGWLASMDVGVAPYPSLANFYFSPMKVYEYMAARVPVVASRIGQLEKLIVQEVNGLLVRPGDAAGLATALERLLVERELGRRLAEAGRATILAGYTWDDVAQKILQHARLKVEYGLA
jgi:glycosyltransferase involved in cell wall biosynthesis